MMKTVLKKINELRKAWSKLQTGFDSFAVISSAFAILAVAACAFGQRLLACMLLIVGYVFFLMGNISTHDLDDLQTTDCSDK
jgi:hypothetical protein